MRINLSFLGRRFLNDAGMTLIEIMIVIAILGGLMAILGTRIASKLEKSRVDNAKIQIREISKFLEMFNTDCGHFPTTEQGLNALRENPGADACPNYDPDGYMKKEQKDPWNHPFIYESDGSNFTVKSLGKDGKDGGDGYNKDITSEEI